MYTHRCMWTQFYIHKQLWIVLDQQMYVSLWRWSLWSGDLPLMWSRSSNNTHYWLPSFPPSWFSVLSFSLSYCLSNFPVGVQSQGKKRGRYKGRDVARERVGERDMGKGSREGKRAGWGRHRGKNRQSGERRKERRMIKIVKEQGEERGRRRREEGEGGKAEEWWGLKRVGKERRGEWEQ